MHISPIVLREHGSRLNALREAKMKRYSLLYVEIVLLVLCMPVLLIKKKTMATVVLAVHKFT